MLEPNLKFKGSSWFTVDGRPRTLAQDGSQKTWDLVLAVPLCDYRQDPVLLWEMKRPEEIFLGPCHVLGSGAFRVAMLPNPQTVEKAGVSVGLFGSQSNGTEPLGSIGSTAAGAHVSLQNCPSWH